MYTYSMLEIINIYFMFVFSEMEHILKSMRWGYKEYDSLTFSPSRENVIKAQLLAEYLFLVIYNKYIHISYFLYFHIHIYFFFR